MRVNTNLSALVTTGLINNASRKSAASMQHLSSGLRINSAKDDSTGLAVSTSMKSQIRGLQQANRNSMDGISLIQTAECGLAEIHSILQRQRELTVQALNGVCTNDDRAKITLEINQLSEEINSLATKTEFNTVNLLAQEVRTKTTVDNVEGSSGNSLTNLTTIVSPPVTDRGFLNLQATNRAGTKTSTLVFTEFDSSQSAIAINDLKIPLKNMAITQTTVPVSPNNWETKFSYKNGSINVDVIQRVSIISDSKRKGELCNIEYEIVNRSTENIQIDFLHNIDVCYKDISVGVSRDNPRFLVDGKEIEGAQIYTKSSIPTEVSLFEEDSPDINAICIFNGSSIITPPDEVMFQQYGNSDVWDFYGGTIGDSVYSAIWKDRNVSEGSSIKLNTLYGVTDPNYNPILNKEPELVSVIEEPEIILQVGANKNQEMKISLCDARTKALNIDNLDVYSVDKGTDTLHRIDEAIEMISNYRVRFGAFQNRLEHVVRNLDSADGNLQESLSRIEDSDMALEISELAKNKILEQSRSAMLTQANQRPEQILQLFK